MSKLTEADLSPKDLVLRIFITEAAIGYWGYERLIALAESDGPRHTEAYRQQTDTIVANRRLRDQLRAMEATV